MPTIGLFSWREPARAVEAGVAVVEDPAVGGHQPVALAVGGGRHADDRLVQLEGTRRAVEAGIPLGNTPPSEAAIQ